MSGVRLIPDNSNPLSLCWLLFASSGPFCLFPYPALSRQDWLLPTALFELPCAPDSCWVSLLQDIYKITVRKRSVHQKRKVTVTSLTSPTMILSTDRMNNLFLFSQDYPSFSIESTTSSDQISHSVVSDSLWPHESQHARPPCPSPTPGEIVHFWWSVNVKKNTTPC